MNIENVFPRFLRVCVICFLAISLISSTALAAWDGSGDSSGTASGAVSGSYKLQVSSDRELLRNSI